VSIFSPSILKGGTLHRRRAEGGYCVPHDDVASTVRKLMQMQQHASCPNGLLPMQPFRHTACALCMGTGRSEDFMIASRLQDRAWSVRLLLMHAQGNREKAGRCAGAREERRRVGWRAWELRDACVCMESMTLPHGNVAEVLFKHARLPLSQCLDYIRKWPTRLDHVEKWCKLHSTASCYLRPVVGYGRMHWEDPSSTKPKAGTANKLSACLP
jgi:hypothetical protein